ncbi:hypothetical protein [Exiguobacterium sp. CH10]|uniref:hypothetical protein n=1 Tax=Exiguobacterium sp. CH10 TaxID=2751261 RepID=UPI001BE8573C|nr:hypothetical protein [Exiguobacterium sp. CH10]
MENSIDEVNINVSYIESLIKNYNGGEFETKINMILQLLSSDYNSTRVVKDGKVDGLQYEKSKKVSATSIYGPEKLEFSKFKKKVDEDYEGVMEFLKTTECDLKEWNFIINKELAAEHIEYVKRKNNYSKKTNIITPSKLMSIIISQNKITEVAMALNAFQYRFPLSLFRSDIFIKLSLDKLCELQKNKEREIKIAELQKIITSIEDQASLFLIKKESGKLKPSNILLEILTGRDFPHQLIKIYKYKDGFFKEVYQDQTIDETDGLIISFSNFANLYLLCNSLLNNVQSNNCYDIQKTLINMSKSTEDARKTREIIRTKKNYWMSSDHYKSH